MTDRRLASVPPFAAALGVVAAVETGKADAVEVAVIIQTIGTRSDGEAGPEIPG
jgi:hypothetical protein